MTNDTPTQAQEREATQWRKKPVVVTASQWFKNGDHPEDYADVTHGFEGGELRTFTGDERKANDWEGSVVRYYRHPGVSGESLCEQCGKTHHVHGWIDTLEQGHRVCPGDWIVTGVKGERYPCKPDIFAATYERATHSPAPASGEAVITSGFSDDMLNSGMVDKLGEEYEALAKANPAAGAEPVYVVRNSEGRIVDAHDSQPDMSTYRGCTLYVYPATSERDAEDVLMLRGVISALGALAPHSKHGDTLHDEVVHAAGKQALYLVAEPEDVEWAGLDPAYYASLNAQRNKEHGA